MPTNERVPDTFTLTIGDATIHLPAMHGMVTVFTETREAFVETIRSLAAMPGASAPRGSGGIAAVVEFGLFFRVSVHTPDDMRTKPVPPPQDRAAMDAAIAEAVAS